MKIWKHKDLEGLWTKHIGRMDQTISSKYGVCFIPYYYKHRDLGKIIPTKTGKYKEEDFICVGER